MTTKVPTTQALGYLPTATPEHAEIVEHGDPSIGGPDATFDARYAAPAHEGTLLGEGGMGEVRLFRDERVGREIAMKVIRPGHGSRSDLRHRFVREARVQGQLEHPAIVPVYDLGVRPDGAAFFTMKRVVGRTLDEVIALLRSGDRAAVAEFSRRKLLDAFARVCQALELAHARGVVHRDLKPGNVMLGGFGEVYVLDWGVAKLTSGHEPAPEVPLRIDAAGTETAAGAVLGTPGYMPPEQIAGDPVDARADVYALGAILFELLTLEPLHPRATLAAVLASTARGADARASVRFPLADVAPELEDVCVRATQADPDQRFANVREMTTAIEAYLDGDRDLARRRELAAHHADLARAAADRALLPETPPDEATELRKTAVREVGRALALDPTHGEAAQTLVRLLGALPKVLPPEARRRLEDLRAEGLRYAATAGAAAYASWVLYLPLLVWMGIREPLAAVVGLALMVSAVVFGIVARTVSARGQTVAGYVALVLSCAAIVVTSRLASPFVVMPVLVITNVVGFSMMNERRHRIGGGLVGAATLVAPVLLERLGVLSPSFVIRPDRIELLPHLVSFANPTATLVSLIVTMLASLYTIGAFAGWVRDRMATTERRAALQAWHFEQLAPDDARSTAPPAPEVWRCVSEVLLPRGATTE